MKNFKYIQPRNSAEASRSLGKNWTGALPVAGGTDLLGLLKDGILAPDTLVNLKTLPGLDRLNYIQGKGLTIGALVSLADIAENDRVREKFPALAQAANEVGSPQLRNQGTLGGNLCQRPRCWYFRGDFPCLRKGGGDCFAVEGESKFHCVIGGAPCFIVSPSNTAPALVALEAAVTINSGKKSRRVPLRDFFILPGLDVTRENILKPGEILTGVEVPDQPGGTRSGYVKIKERDVWDFATVSAAAVLQIGSSRVTRASVVLGGVAPKPWIEEKVSKALVGLSLEDTGLPGKIRQAASLALQDAEPMEHNGYKVTLARNALAGLLGNLLEK